MTSSPNLDQMTPDQLRAFAAQLMSKVDTMGRNGVFQGGCRRPSCFYWNTEFGAQANAPVPFNL
jgi:hypothetical protein